MGGILTKMPPMGGKSPLGGLKGSTEYDHYRNHHPDHHHPDLPYQISMPETCGSTTVLVNVTDDLIVMETGTETEVV